MADAPSDECVFINCPLDKEFEPLLQAMLFCVLFLGFVPQFASQRGDSAENRLAKIQGLIEASRYSIHDLSRIQAKEAGEFFRLNMPFELGLDYGCRMYLEGRGNKKLLILEEKAHRYHAALSDLNGCDLEAHGGDFQKVVRKVRNWLVAEAGAPTQGAARILAAYSDFQEWYYERQLAAGFSEEDIQDYPTAELLAAMSEWLKQGRPIP